MLVHQYTWRGVSCQVAGAHFSPSILWWGISITPPRVVWAVEWRC
jgi:hypothetical protein